MNAIDDIEDLYKFEFYELCVFLYKTTPDFDELYVGFLSISLLI
jgi:hypothetical protein